MAVDKLHLDESPIEIKSTKKIEYDLLYQIVERLCYSYRGLVEQFDYVFMTEKQEIKFIRKLNTIEPMKHFDIALEHFNIQHVDDRKNTYTILSFEGKLYDKKIVYAFEVNPTLLVDIFFSNLFEEKLLKDCHENPDALCVYVENQYSDDSYDEHTCKHTSDNSCSCNCYNSADGNNSTNEENGEESP